MSQFKAGASAERPGRGKPRSSQRPDTEAPTHAVEKDEKERKAMETMTKRITRFCLVALSGSGMLMAQAAGAVPRAQAGSGHMPTPQQRLEMMRKMPQMRADAAQKAAAKG